VSADPSTYISSSVRICGLRDRPSQIISITIETSQGTAAANHGWVALSPSRKLALVYVRDGPCMHACIPAAFRSL
jgi:hypothetical protein